MDALRRYLHGCVHVYKYTTLCMYTRAHYLTTYISFCVYLRWFPSDRELRAVRAGRMSKNSRIRQGGGSLVRDAEVLLVPADRVYDCAYDCASVLPGGSGPESLDEVLEQRKTRKRPRPRADNNEGNAVASGVGGGARRGPASGGAGRERVEGIERKGNCVEGNDTLLTSSEALHLCLQDTQDVGESAPAVAAVAAGPSSTRHESMFMPIESPVEAACRCLEELFGRLLVLMEGEVPESQREASSHGGRNSSSNGSGEFGVSPSKSMTTGVEEGAKWRQAQPTTDGEEEGHGEEEEGESLSGERTRDGGAECVYWEGEDSHTSFSPLAEDDSVYVYTGKERQGGEYEWGGVGEGIYGLEEGGGDGWEEVSWNEEEMFPTGNSVESGEHA